MGTTEQKLEYLATTKTKIKDSINLTGAGITTEPFRQYAVKLKDAYVDIINNGTETLYSNFPKVSATGESMELSNTYEAPMQIDLKGNTSQVQLSGKNLIDVSKGRLGNWGGLTLTSSNGELIVNGTANSFVDVYLYIADQYNIPLVNFLNNKTGTYTLSNDKGYETYFRLQSGFKQTTATISPQDTTINCFIRIPAGTYNNLSIKAQLEQGSTATSYEQYCGGTPSPNPSYPQDIHNVSGNNNIVVCGKNMLGIADKSTTTNLGLTYSITNNEITINGKTTSEGRIILGKLITPIVLDSSKTYKLSQVSSGTASPDTFSIQLRTDSSNVVVQTFRSLSANAETISNISETITYIGLYIANNTQFTNVKIKWQLEENNSATTYEAYNGTTYPINLPVENLFDKDNANIENGYIDNAGMMLITSQLNRLFYIPCKPNTTYTISRSIITSTFRVATYDSTPFPSTTSTSSTYSISGLIKDNSATSITITTGANAKYLIVHYGRLETDPNIEESLATIQIEYGSKANTYTPYGTTPIELNKIGTYQDYIYKENDKWYLHKEIGKVVLDGTESSWSIGNGGWYSQSFINEIKPSSQALSNKYVYTSNTWQGNYTFSINSSGFIAISDNRYPVRADWINYLINNNIDMLCVLDTPTNTEITDTTLIEQLEAIYNAKSKNGTTNINQENNDLPFILDVSALLGSES